MIWPRWSRNTQGSPPRSPGRALLPPYFPTLESFAQADIEEVGEYVHSCGFFRAKSKDMVLCAQMLLHEYGAFPENIV